VVGHGPSHTALAFFLALAALLVVLALWAPCDLLRPTPGPRRLGSVTLGFLGAVEFLAYFAVLILAGTHAFPADVAALLVVAANGGVLFVLLRYVGTQDLERSEFLFAVGMLSVLFLWDVLIEFILVPGILGVTAVFVYLLYRLNRTLATRAAPTRIPPGVTGVPPASP